MSEDPDMGRTQHKGVRERAKGNLRFFDCGSHDNAVSAFAQDDTSILFYPIVFILGSSNLELL